MDVFRSSPAAIAPLLGLDEMEQFRQWRNEELSEILQHQLAAPLLFDLAEIMSSVDVTIPRGEIASIGSFGDLLSHPSPPLALLKLMKEFAKSADRAAEAPLPEQIATVLYYSAIIAALVRHEERISSLDGRTLRQGVEWRWISAGPRQPLRSLFVEGQVFLDTRNAED